MLKKGTSASPATALASKVFPVPGGPTSKAPLGILPPRAVYFLGLRRKSTISITSSLAPYKPATSLKVTLTLSLSASLPLALPTLNGFMPPAPPPMLRVMPRIMKIHSTTRTTRGSHSRRPLQMFSLFSIMSLTRDSCGNSSLRAEKVVSGSNLVEVRKKNWGELLGGVPPGNSLLYFCTDSGRRDTVPLKSFRT